MDLGITHKTPSTPALTMKKFSGINNRDNDMRIEQDMVDYNYIFPLSQANNVDIDDTFMVSSRPGKTFLLTCTDGHSLWSDGIKCFFVDGTTLYQMLEDNSVVTIRSGLTSGARMRFAPFNNKVYYANGYECGYVLDYVNYSFADPGINFKASISAGSFIGVYRSCIFMAVNNILFISDPLCDYFDIRYGYRVFKDKITMVCPVSNGLYIADSKTWFMHGSGNDEFELTEKSACGAVMHTDVTIMGNEIDANLTGRVAIWTGTDGIYLGDANGNVTNLTDEKYILPARRTGCAYIRDINQVKHYINSIL